jgi:hypothetical protein
LARRDDYGPVKMVRLIPPVRDASPWYTSALLITAGLVAAVIAVLLEKSWTLVGGVLAAFVFGAVIAHRRRDT